MEKGFSRKIDADKNRVPGDCGSFYQRLLSPALSSTKAWRRGCQGQATLHSIRTVPNWRGLVGWRKKPTFSWVESAPGDGLRELGQHSVTSFST